MAKKTHHAAKVVTYTLEAELENVTFSMSAEDYAIYYEMLAADPGYGVREHRERPKPTVACKFCKVSGLHWVNKKGYWKLFDSAGKLHNCRSLFVSDETEDDEPF